MASQSPCPAANSPAKVALSCLVHPFSLLALALLALNDHYLKGIGPAWLTGKLSDFAGLFYFPFLVIFLVSILPSRSSSTLRVGRATFWGVGLWFAAAKSVPWVHDQTIRLSEFLLGEVQVVLDPTDLVALVSLVPAWALYKHMAVRPRPSFLRQCKPIILGVSVLLTAATSQPPNPRVEKLVVKDDLLYAIVEDSLGTTIDKSGELVVAGVFSTTDGIHWLPTSLQAEDFEGYENYPDGIPEDIAFRLLSGEDDWKVSYDRAEFTELFGARVNQFRSVAAPPQSLTTIVRALGTEGIVTSSKDGSVARLSLGGASPTPTQVNFYGALELVAAGQWVFGVVVTLVLWMLMSLLSWCNAVSGGIPLARVVGQQNEHHSPSVILHIVRAWNAFKRLRFFGNMKIGVVFPILLLALNLRVYRLVGVLLPHFLWVTPFAILSLLSIQLAWKRFLKAHPGYVGRTHLLPAVGVGTISVLFFVLWDMAWIQSSTTSFVLSLVLMLGTLLWHAARVGMDTPRGR